MNFIGKVSQYNPSNHSYLINFEICLENNRLTKGYAYVYLKMGETQLEVYSIDKNKLDVEHDQFFLKVKFLEAIYDYNVHRISRLNSAI